MKKLLLILVTCVLLSSICTAQFIAISISCPETKDVWEGNEYMSIDSHSISIPKLGVFFRFSSTNKDEGKEIIQLYNVIDKDGDFCEAFFYRHILYVTYPRFHVYIKFKNK